MLIYVLSHTFIQLSFTAPIIFIKAGVPLETGFIECAIVRKVTARLSMIQRNSFRQLNIVTLLIQYITDVHY